MFISVLFLSEKLWNPSFNLTFVRKREIFFSLIFVRKLLKPLYQSYLCQKKEDILISVFRLWEKGRYSSISHTFVRKREKFIYKLYLCQKKREIYVSVLLLSEKERNLSISLTFVRRSKEWLSMATFTVLLVSI
jgi:hypothetical protein